MSNKLKTIIGVILMLTATSFVWMVATAPSPEVAKQQKEEWHKAQQVQKVKAEKARQEDEERRWRDWQNSRAAEVITELQTKTIWVFYDNACYMKYVGGSDAYAIGSLSFVPCAVAEPHLSLPHLEALKRARRERPGAIY